jgi:hypothetical protein
MAQGNYEGTYRRAVEKLLGTIGNTVRLQEFRQKRSRRRASNAKNNLDMTFTANGTETFNLKIVGEDMQLMNDLGSWRSMAIWNGWSLQTIPRLKKIPNRMIQTRTQNRQS